MINQNDIKNIVDKTNIVDIIAEDIALSKKGRNYVGLCKFHDDKNPSLIISEDKQYFKCFSCGAGGNVVEYLKKSKNISFLESIKILAQKQNIFLNIKDNKENKTTQNLEEYKLLKDINSFFQANSLQSKEAQEYFKERQLDLKTRNKFLIGYAPFNAISKYYNDKIDNTTLKKLVHTGLKNADYKDYFYNRIIFAITDEFNNIVGFSGRALDKDNSIKYLNSPESKIFQKSNILYNYYNATQNNPNNELFIVEGFMDAIALDKVGISNAVALMGLNLSKEHIKLLKNKKIIMFLDNDDAGKKAQTEIIRKLRDNKIKCEVIEHKNNYKDVDEMLNNTNKNYVNEYVKENRISDLN